MAVVGIDLGTTNTVVACVRAGRVQVLADDHGRRLLPSVVSFHPNGDVLVGHSAKERRVVDAKNTIASVKRLLGRAWASDEITRARQRFAFDLKEGPGQGPLVVARGQEYTLPEISAFVLKRARSIAEAALGETVDRAVITVPANFNELQRAATKVAGRVAGLDVLRIINEPTAAALAYGLVRTIKERIAIYDFGGGTFDCTLLDLSGNVFEVLATAGDTFLGGDDLDVAIAERMSDAFLHAHRYDPRSDPQAFERLRVAGELIKIELSSHERAHTKLREVAFGIGGAHLDLDFGMTRDELEMLAMPLVERTFAVCQEALSIARLPVSAFDKVILVGGSTRIPLVRRRVEQFFGAPPLDRVNPDEVVAIGAAIQAAALTEVERRRSIPPPPVPGGARKTYPSAPEEDEEVTVTAQVSELLRGARQSTASSPDVPRTTQKMGFPHVGTTTARMPSASSLPRPPSNVGSTPRPLGAPPAPAVPDPALTIPTPIAFEDILRSTPPPPAPRRDMFAPAIAPPTKGASSAAPSVEPRLPLVMPSRSEPPPVPSGMPPVLVDVTPRALAVETVGGWCDVVVQRNAKIPCERTRAFATSSDMQTLVRVRVAQGEDAVFANNTYLGQVELVGLRAAPRGEVTIQVRFEIDESGTLKVFAIDVTTGREAHAVLQLVGIAGAQGIEAMQARQAAMRVS
jgi:molecular chaperone DnaK